MSVYYDVRVGDEVRREIRQQMGNALQAVVLPVAVGLSPALAQSIAAYTTAVEARIEELQAAGELVATLMDAIHAAVLESDTIY